MKLFRILHLSDIHIGATYMKSRDIAYRIISDIENENLSNIQCVVVTGDIFEGRLEFKEELVTEAVDFFNILYDELKKSTDLEKSDFLFIPGNHDILRVKDETKRWKKYHAFLEAFYNGIPDFYDMNDFSLIKTYDDSRIVFAGFNSCALKEEPIIDTKLSKSLNQIEDSEFSSLGISKGDLLDFINNQTKKSFVDFGEIPPRQILNVMRKLKKFDDYNIVAFFHHHFYLFPEVYTRYGDSSLIINYTNVIQQMLQAGVRTVLHGHKHFDLERPLITDSYYDNAKNIINVIAGGSVGTDRVSKHTFNIIDFYDKDYDLQLVQRKFVYNNDQLEPVTSKQIPPKANNNDIKIKLLEIFNLNNPDLYSSYVSTKDRINIVADDYNNIVRWLENIFIGFQEIHRIFENDPLCIFFLLFAMNYRVLKMKKVIGKENINSSYYQILKDFLDKSIPDVGFDKNSYLKIFEQKDLGRLKKKADEILIGLQSKKAKYYLSFSMIGVFITDIYLMLRYYAGDFYNRNIKYKVNINLDENEFHQNIPVNKIMIYSDADRRSAFIDLKCTSATAHKLAVLFVKEFELIISKYEDYFKIVGLKIYYLSPRIEKSDMPNAIDNYNFEAYIPTLIPLLTGDNIYAQKEVFARELIQNSIDAIAVRASSDSEFDQTIYITFGRTQGRDFFRIKDYGTGMDRFKIERYFTSIGRSFYSGDEYRDLDLDYNPISSFGIGFLSAFMICREIDVKTRYYLDDKEGLRLHIPNYDGCFFIEKDDSLDIGTEITLYIDKKISHNITAEEITNYICDTMQDINCDIVIEDQMKKQTITIPSHNIRQVNNTNGILFIPFLESGRIDKNIDLKKTIWSGEFTHKYPYGMIVNIDGCDTQNISVLNSGIRLNDTTVNDVWEMLLKKELGNLPAPKDYFFFNFPAHYINVDVSREKITDFNNNIIDNKFILDLIEETINQVEQYISLSKSYKTSNKAVNVYLLMMRIALFCRQNSALSNLYDRIKNMQYKLYIRYNQDTLDLLVGRVGSQPENAVAYIPKKHTEFYNGLINTLPKSAKRNAARVSVWDEEYSKIIISDIHDFVAFRGHIYEDSFFRYFLYRKDINNKRFSEIKSYVSKKYKIRKPNIEYAFLLLMAITGKKEEKMAVSLMEDLLMLLLNNFTVSEVENGKCCVSIAYEDIENIIKKSKDD